MIRIAMIDDEPSERELLRSYFERLEQELQITVQLDQFSSGTAFLTDFDGSYGMVCLDIDMPGMNGIETAKALRRKDEEVLIVFVTNMAQMALQGYEVHAFDFLVKPVNYFSFSMKLSRAFQIIASRRSGILVIETSSGVQKLSTEELYYVEVRGHYLYYHTMLGVFRERSSMRELERKLEDYPFFRCHYAYLVNLQHVTAMLGEQIIVGGDELPVSRANRRAFSEKLTGYLGGISLK